MIKPKLKLTRRPHRRGPGRGAPQYRADLRHRWELSTYALPVSVTTEVRLTKFETWVKRKLIDVQTANGWSMADVAQHTPGVSSDTIYAWRRGDWKKAGKPGPEKVIAFCEGLGLDSMEAFKILGWTGRTIKRPVATRHPLANELDEILLNPNVDKEEKHLLEAMVSRLLAPFRKPPRK